MDMLDERGEPAAAEAVDWAAARAVYEAGEVPVQRICEAHGITYYELKKRRIAEGWTARPRVAVPALGCLPRRPIEAAVNIVVRLMDLQAERLAEVPGPVGEKDMLALIGLGKLAEGLMREDTLRRQLAGPTRPAARRKSTARAALDGGHNKEQEARAADVEWMRAELKRRVALLRRSAGRDVQDRPAGGGER